MPLEDEIARLDHEFNELLKKFREQEKLGDGFEKVATRMGKGFSRGTLYRICFPETHGKNQKPETRRNSLEAAIRRLNELLGTAVLPPPPEAPRPPLLPPGKQAPPPGQFHEFTIYYWDWSTPADSDAGQDTGSVVTGYLRLPINWKGKGALLRLPDGTEAKGKVWVQSYKPGKHQLSARFVRLGAPDLFMTLHIASEKQLSLLVGAFATADVERHSPLHGTVYLRAIQTETDKTGTVNGSQPDNDPTGLMIKQALFQQTYVQKDRQPLPDFVKGSYRTLTDALLGKTFRGYFIHTHGQALESFKLRVHDDGRITIVYCKGKTEVGQFRSYYEKVIWFAFDYDIKWGIHRYRMLFWKHKEPGWYLGLGSGSEPVGTQIFMNRVAMVETDEAWDMDTLKVDDPISLDPDNQDKLAALFAQHPVLREYLSGEPSATILNNERLSETPHILKLAGFLSESAPALSDIQTPSADFRALSGPYCLYSLAREPTPDGKDEHFEIVEMPLTIDASGKLVMIGQDKKYFGQAQREGERLVLLFTERLLDGNDKPESTFMSYCLRLHANDGKFIGHSQGTMVRFVSAMPEARTVMMIAGKRSDTEDTYKAYKIFSPEWVALRKGDRDYLTRQFAGRINRIIAPHGDGKKLPENRQKEFRELYAHAAQAYHNDPNHKVFIDYFHKAALHNYGEEERDSTLFKTLNDWFNKSYTAHYKLWNPITKRKADELKIYLQLITTD